MENEVLTQQTEELEAYYYEDLDKDMSEMDNRTFQNRTKVIQMLLEQKNQHDKIELENKRLDFEIKQSKKQNEIEEKKIEVEKQKAADEAKKGKKEFWLGVGKCFAGIAGAVGSLFLTFWSIVSCMKFEETGSFRTSVGKKSQALADKTSAKLENINNKM